MDKFIFNNFMDNGKERFARLETANHNIPVNIYAEEDSDFDLQNGELCETSVFGVGSGYEVYRSEKEYYEHHEKLASVSLFPIGLFPSSPDDKDWEESCHVMFSGKVIDFLPNPYSEDENINCLIFVETLDMTIGIYTKYDGIIEEGYYIHGIAWLFGDIARIS